MSKYDLSEIERTTQEVLRIAGALTIPTDLDKVLKSLSVRMHEEELEKDISGVLIIKGDERHILLNKTHSDVRKRFTLAHELGHLVLHDQSSRREGNERMFIDRQIRVYQRVSASASQIYDQDGSLTDAEQEKEANAFAACVLMPSHHVVRAAQERELDDEAAVASLAKSFGVSEQAMANRLQQLKLLSLNLC